MTEKEENELRAVYEQWPDSRLAKAVHQNKNEYRPEASALMFDILEKRGIAPEALPMLAASAPHPSPISNDIPKRDTFFMPARLPRMRYLARKLVFLVILISLNVALEFWVKHHLTPEFQSGVTLVIIFIAGLYDILGMEIPRVRDAGLSPTLLLLFLLPPAGIVLLILLFVLPSKTRQPSTAWEYLKIKTRHDANL
ncbi:MAG: hypothetical protein LBI02_05680 [Opitutaceae bacterium]|jgi:uncharacterized membrane protein YhaH (DUF805 family)|nr:hypothetical protein [Opitutaceae bacterium]